jgi:hypothetical protein
MPSDTPVSEVLGLVKKGLQNEEITRQLEAKGYTLQQISDAINQAHIKQGVEGNMPPQNMQESIMDEEIPLPQQETQIQQQPQDQGFQPQQQSYSMPQQQAYSMPQSGGPSYQDMQAIVEQIVEEKWKEMVQNVGDINVFRARVSDDVESMKQELLRTQKRLEDLQVAVVGKVKDYNKSVLDIGNDMKALEKVFGKILEPLAMNVKELSRITKELKK